MLGRMTLHDTLSAGREVADHRPWPRWVLDEAAWRRLVEQLSLCDWTLLGLWGDSGAVHVALRDDEAGQIAVATLPCGERGSFPSLGAVRPGALRLERAAHDLFGLTPKDSPDARPWLDHGRWPLRQPLAAARQERAPEPHRYRFLPVEGEGLHQIPVGPVHAGIIEPGHFRFTAQGETVVRLEERLGYQHKGTEGLMAGRTVAEAARLAGRVSGDSTVAYAIAFARAIEAATDTEAPPRAHWLRALMAELERIANHVFDFGAVCNDAAFSLMLAECTTLRERILQANDACFGHRLMMDKVVPGGVAVDLTRDGIVALRRLMAQVKPKFTQLAELYDGMPSLLDRTQGTGTVSASLVHRFGAGGFVGRASSRGIDARATPGYAPYPDLDLQAPLYAGGDVHSRLLVRIDEVGASIAMIEHMLEHLPGGPLHAPTPARAGEGMALVESFRGDVLVWLRLEAEGRVARCHLRDPSWFQWPLLEAAIEGNIVADFPLCNKSFNCSYSGHDL